MLPQKSVTSNTYTGMNTRIGMTKMARSALSYGPDRQRVTWRQASGHKEQPSYRFVCIKVNISAPRTVVALRAEQRCFLLGSNSLLGAGVLLVLPAKAVSP
jgi:hypothetical protein